VIVDLVSPWVTAVEAKDSASACREFRARHAGILDAIRRQRLPHLADLPLPVEPDRLRLIAARAADQGWLSPLSDLVAQASALGADRCQSVILLPGNGTGDPAEPLPGADGAVAFLVEPRPADIAERAALLVAITSLTRWDRLQPRGAEWNRWQAAQEHPLREWIYTAGLSMHMVLTVLASVEPQQALGVSRTAFARLRQRERVFAALLERDLDRTGAGLVMRWLLPAAPASLRIIDGVTLPPMAGYYLAWRMVSNRVARAGLRGAMLLSV
jgi:hypothetical protein